MNKSLYLIVAIIFGAFCYKLHFLSALTPYALMLMLFFPSLKADFSLDSKKIAYIAFGILSIWIFAILVYFACLGIFGNSDVSTSALIITTSPIATAAVIMTEIIGGNTLFVLSISIISNIVNIFAWPILFESLFSQKIEMLFMLEKLFFIVCIPLIIAKCIKKDIKIKLIKYSDISFYAWLFGIFINIAAATNFIIQNQINYTELYKLAIITPIICIGHYFYGILVGKIIGLKWEISQSFVQRNTFIAVWLANTFFNPFIALGPIFYVLCQNIYNVIQVGILKKQGSKMPKIKPKNTCFGSGPCSKRPGFTVNILKDAPLGRSHRSAESLKLIREVIEKSVNLLNLPTDYKIAIMPASDTGAFEAAMWNMLGYKEVDVIFFEEFGKNWRNDIINELKIPNTREFKADFGKAPDLTNLDFSHDIVFTLNGTTSGVCFHNLDFIPSQRTGLVFCDATSAVFSIPIDFLKLDVITYSWQKSIGGEAQHGILILSPKAIDRLNTFQPLWPIPKIFQIKKNGKLDEEVFNGSTINTPSMLCIYDALDGMKWLENIGQKNIYKIVNDNYTALANFIEETSWLTNMCHDEKYRSKTSVCFTINDLKFNSMLDADKKARIKSIAEIISQNNAGFDIINHKSAPASFRVWCGPTVQKNDILALCKWIDYAYEKTKT